MMRLTALLTALLLLCGCSELPDESLPSETDTLPQEENTIRQETQQLGELVLAYDPAEALNPYLTESSVNRSLTGLACEGLFAVTQNGEWENVLCSHYEVSPDEKSYTFYLRNPVMMHDGKPLEPEDVIASWKAAMASERYAYRLRHVTNITKKNATAITVTLDTPYDRLPMLLDVPVLREKSLKMDVPVGTGAFYFSGDKMLPFQSWWKAIPPLNQISLYHAATAKELEAAFSEHQISAVYVDPNGSGVPVYHNNESQYVIQTNTMQYLGFRMDEGLFADSHLRTAVTYLIDRERLVADTCSGFAAAASLPANPSGPTYDRNLAARYDYDPDSFSKSVQDDEAAFGEDVDGLITAFREDSIPAEGVLIVNASFDRRRLAAEEIADMLWDYGIHLSVQALRTEDYLQALRDGKYDAYLGEVTLAPDGDLSTFFDPYGALCFGGTENAMLLHLCENALENIGNYYTLYDNVMQLGVICPLLFRQHMVYTQQAADVQLQPTPANPYHLIMEEAE